MHIDYEKLMKTHESIYVEWPHEDAKLRRTPGEGEFIKFKGKDERKTHPDSRLASDAWRFGKEITKEEYESDVFKE